MRCAHSGCRERAELNDYCGDHRSIGYELVREKPKPTPNTPQPPPKRGRAVATWDLVRTDIEERERMGLLKYGVRHQHDNGRDHLVDLYQELLDAVVYLRAEIERRGAR